MPSEAGAPRRCHRCPGHGNQGITLGATANVLDGYISVFLFLFFSETHTNCLSPKSPSVLSGWLSCSSNILGALLLCYILHTRMSLPDPQIPPASYLTIGSDVLKWLCFLGSVLLGKVNCECSCCWDCQWPLKRCPVSSQTAATS